MPKTQYRVRNWKDYNQALVQRGSITLWFDEDSLQNWTPSQQSPQKGRPCLYSDTAILCGLTIKSLFKLTFRMTEGFLKSLVKLLGLDIPIPHYTLLCKRQKHLSVDIPQRSASKEPIHLLIDTTGLKIFGEGEWVTRKHGISKRRTWRKLHLAINADTHDIESFVLTKLGVQDWDGVPDLLNNIDKPIEKLTADKSYDKFSCYDAGANDEFELITPPLKGARTSEETGRKRTGACDEAVANRDETVKAVRQYGEAEWKKRVGYHRRSLVETAMFRFKTMLGNGLQTRKLENQVTEAAVKCRILNKMTSLGMPESVAL